MNKAAISLTLCLFFSMPYLAMAQEHGYLPEQGFVSDEQTAMAVAEAVVSRIYGREKIENQKPFVATLRNGIWTVSGTLHKNMPGGVFVIKIDKKDSRIISLSHEK